MNQIKFGAILSYISIIVSMLVALIYTPIIIRQLGQSEYGLYSMIGSISAYLSVMDMGLGNAVIRYNSRNRAVGDKESESRLNGMFLLLYAAIGILTVFFGFAIYSSVNRLFGGSLSIVELSKARLMIVILTINFSISMPLSVFGSIMQSYEKFVVVKGIAIIRTVMVPLISVPFLFLGHGSVMMVLITTIINISCLLFNVYYCLNKLKVRFYFRKIEYSVLIEIIGYSFFVFLGVIVDQINWNTGQIILGIVSGTLAVALYALAMQFIRIYMQFSTSLSGVFLPRVSMMVANNASNSELTGMLIKYGRIQYIIMGYILGGFILLGQQFIIIWAGENYSQSYYIALFIMLPFTIDLIQNICLSILQAKNYQRFRSVVLILIAIGNVIISFPLGEKYGGLGVAFGTGFSYFIGAGIVMNIYYYKRLGLDIPLFWKNIAFMSIPMISSVFVGIGLNYLISDNTIPNMILKGILYSISYFIFMSWKGFNDYERGLLAGIFTKFKFSHK